MKKVLFISNYNLVAKGVHEALMSYEFHTQICAPVESSVKGILSIYTPDAIILSLTGLSHSDESLLYLISINASNIPVITVGTITESKLCTQYYEENKFIGLIRPVSNTKIVMELCKCLNIELPQDNLASDEEEVEEETDNRKHILCVDDSGAMLRKIQSLIPETYRVSLVNSGTKAIAMIEKDRPDLIFLDYDMPVVDGRQTLEMIRSEKEFASIPVVFMTGKNDRESIESVISLKPAGYLLKPPNTYQLLERIQAIIG